MSEKISLDSSETFTNKNQLKYEEHSFYLFVRIICILRMC